MYCLLMTYSHRSQFIRTDGEEVLSTFRQKKDKATPDFINMPNIKKLNPRLYSFSSKTNCTLHFSNWFTISSFISSRSVFTHLRHTCTVDFHLLSGVILQFLLDLASFQLSAICDERKWYCHCCEKKRMEL